MTLSHKCHQRTQVAKCLLSVKIPIPESLSNLIENNSVWFLSLWLLKGLDLFEIRKKYCERFMLIMHIQLGLFVDHFKSQDVYRELFLLNFQLCMCMRRNNWRKNKRTTPHWTSVIWNSQTTNKTGRAWTKWKAREMIVNLGIFKTKLKTRAQ